MSALVSMHGRCSVYVENPMLRMQEMKNQLVD